MANITATSQEQLNAAYLRGVAEMATAIKPSLFVTLAFNRAIVHESAADRLTAFLARMDRKLLGPKWASQDASRRTQHISVLENPRTNPHIHLLVKPAKNNAWAFAKRVGPIWRKLVVSGSIDVQPVTDLAGAINYVAKHLSASKGDRLLLTPGKA
ncbi:hypothetical protein [Belnapia sp. F-4-1]|uniref:hypothetical protein n=1 Tax=Belnapia sp. F-4-1 TaxID=1545443 RepID=UPI001186A799|nr:hypothetical protein [Belnapia sp. F-4-1]